MERREHMNGGLYKVKLPPEIPHHGSTMTFFKALVVCCNATQLAI